MILIILIEELHRTKRVNRRHVQIKFEVAKIIKGYILLVSVGIFYEPQPNKY